MMKNSRTIWWKRLRRIIIVRAMTADCIYAMYIPSLSAPNSLLRRLWKGAYKAATSVVRRILDTDPTFNPEHTATGHWNFFERFYIRNKQDSYTLTYNNPRWSFELKNTGIMNMAEYPVLCNDILGILRDATNFVWSDEWRVGASPIVEYTDSWDDIKHKLPVIKAKRLPQKPEPLKTV